MRAPNIPAGEESFVPSVPGVRVSDFMADLELRGGMQTAENRAVIANALTNRQTGPLQSVRSRGGRHRHVYASFATGSAHHAGAKLIVTRASAH